MTKKKRGNSNKRVRKTKEEEFIVEKILGRRINEDGVIEYKVRWKGYSFEDDTWEPEENCQTCPELIDEFEKGRSNDVDNQDTDIEENSNDINNRKRPRSTPDDGMTTKSRRNGRSSANRNYKEDTSDDEEKEVGKDSVMELDKSIASKDITVDDSDDSIGFTSKHFDKENDASKIQPEFEIEEDDEDDRNIKKKSSPSDMFDEIMRKTNSVSASNKDELVAEKIIKAGILSGGRIHFIVKIEGVEEPQTYAAEDAHRLFPQQVIAFYQSRVRWK